MEPQRILSDMLMAAIVILAALAILYPVTLSIMSDADAWLARRGIHGRRDLRRKLTGRWVAGYDDGSLAARAWGWFRTARRNHRAAPIRDPEGRPSTKALGVAAASETVAFEVPERRRYKRLKTQFLGTLHPNAPSLDTNLCDVIDLSAGGARVRPVEPMPDGRLVALGIRHFGVFPARVVWRSSRDIGLRFLQDPEEVAEALRGLIPAQWQAREQTARTAFDA